MIIINGTLVAVKERRFVTKNGENRSQVQASIIDSATGLVHKVSFAREQTLDVVLKHEHKAVNVAVKAYAKRYRDTAWIDWYDAQILA